MNFAFILIVSLNTNSSEFLFYLLIKIEILGTSETITLDKFNISKFNNRKYL